MQSGTGGNIRIDMPGLIRQKDGNILTGIHGNKEAYMKKLVFNDSRQIEVQNVVEAGEGILRVRMILATPESLKSLFGDTFATQKMTYFENQTQAAVYENYTKFEYIKEGTGGIFEVEMRQTVADTGERLKDLEEKAENQAEELEKVKKDLAESSGSGVDQALLAASLVVAKANAQTLTDGQALEAKALYDTFDDLVKAKYTAEKQGFKFRDGKDLWKTAQDNVKFQAQYRPGQGTESLYTHIDEAHARTQEDPIPAKANMEYEYGKYYSEGDMIYICERGGVPNPEELYGQKVVLQYLPSALIGQYFRLVS